jgi:rhomboid family GlyGly-CTERM serine protease
MKILARMTGTLLISCFVLILHLTPFVAPIFELDSREPNQLFSYRIITCHTLHWSWNHLVWDLLMFTLLGAICEATDRFKYLIYLALSTILIPHVVLACHPELATYRGLSGIDSGLFAMLALDRIMECRRSGDRVGLLVFAGCFLCLTIKIACETWYGGNLFVSDSTFVPVPISHVTGAVSGVIICLLFQQKHQPNPRTRLNVGMSDGQAYISSPIGSTRL